MRGAILGILAGTALALGSTAANAAITTAINSGTLNSTGTAGFIGTLAGTGGTSGFNDDALFNLVTSYFVDGQVSTIQIVGTKDIDFSSIYIDVNDSLHSFTQIGFDATGTETWQLYPGINLAAGDHHLYLNGSATTTLGQSATYTGSLNLAAVPEPATWALMLLGFGGIGMAMRRRRRPVFAQIA